MYRQPITGLMLLAAILAGCTDATHVLAPFEAPSQLPSFAVVPLAAKLCQKNGWMQLAHADGSAFTGQGDCVSYVAMGGKFGQTISFTSANPSPVQIDDPSYTPQATASSGLPVTFSLDAASTGCSLSAGVVSFTAAGTCLINANQAGDKLWAAAQVQQSITVNNKSQTISFTSTNPSPVHVGDPDYTPQATATSGLAVTFSLGAASTGCSLLAGVVSFTAAGTCLIDANQTGGGVWAPAPPVQQSIAVTVNPAQYCASIGGTYGGQSSNALWTCNGWTATSVSDAAAKADALVAACRADNGAVIGGFDYVYTLPFPTTVDARCHLPS